MSLFILTPKEKWCLQLYIMNITAPDVGSVSAGFDTVKDWMVCIVTKKPPSQLCLMFSFVDMQHN